MYDVFFVIRWGLFGAIIGFDLLFDESIRWSLSIGVSMSFMGLLSPVVFFIHCLNNTGNGLS